MSIMMAGGQRRPCKDWITLAACLGFCLLYPLSFSTAGLFFIELAPHYGMGNKAITWIAACQTGIGCIFGIVSGIWLKKLGPRIMGSLATCVAVIGLLTGPFVDNIFFLYISFGAMFGIGSSTMCLVAFTMSFQTFPQHRPLMGGLLATFISVGGFVWTPLTELLIEHFTWKGALVVLSGIHLHGFVFSMMISNPTPSTREDIPSRSPADASYGPVVVTDEQLEGLTGKSNMMNELNGTAHEQLEKSLMEKTNPCDHIKVKQIEFGIERPKKPNWRVTGVLFLFASMLTISCHMNFYTYIPIINGQNGFSKQQGALLLSVVNICSGVARLPAGLLGNVRGVSCSLIYALSTLGAAGLSMSSILCSSYQAMLVMSGCYGLCAGCYMSLQSAALLDQTHPKYLTVVMGLQQTTQGLAIFVLHGSAGFILDSLGDGNILFFIFGSFGLLSGAIVLSLFFTSVAYRLRWRRHRETLSADQQNYMVSPK